jgi:hypothetical protein
MSTAVEPHPMEIYAVSFWENAFYGPQANQINLERIS